MKIKVKNFGPIKNVDLEVRPLTIIIGRNNLGKSYLSQLYYALLDSSREFGSSVGRPRYYARYYPYRVKRVHYLNEERTHIFLGPRPTQLSLDGFSRQIKKDMSDSELIKIIAERVIAKYERILSKILRLSLERTFAVKINKLVNISSNFAEVSWDLFEHFSSTIQITKRGAFKVELSLLDTGTALIKILQKELAPLFKKIRRARTRKFEHVADVIHHLEPRLMSYKKNKEGNPVWAIIHRRFTSPYYIPAGRGGLLESYETVVGGLISLSPLAPVRGLSMPPLPGMASQFYNVLLRLRGEKGPLSNKVNTAFRDLLEGDVRLKKMQGQAKSRLVYKFSSGNKSSSTDVVHAASMIKEISPIYLIVHELVKPHDYLLIEEPESHLHPGAQIKFVDIISTLVANKVNVFLTTHSDLLLRKVGHLVTKKRENQEIGQNSETIAIYWLKKDDGGSSSEIIEIPKDGVLQDIPTFDDVVKDLYEEELELEKTLEGRD